MEPYSSTAADEAITIIERTNAACLHARLAPPGIPVPAAAHPEPSIAGHPAAPVTATVTVRG